MPFGPKAAKGESNDGINIAARRGDTIRAAAAGTVTYTGGEPEYYRHLIPIRPDDGRRRHAIHPTDPYRGRR